MIKLFVKNEIANTLLYKSVLYKFSETSLCFINEYICFTEPRNLNCMILLEFIGMNITHNFATIGFGHMPFPKECLNASVQDRMQ